LTPKQFWQTTHSTINVLSNEPIPANPGKEAGYTLNRLPVQTQFFNPLQAEIVKSAITESHEAPGFSLIPVSDYIYSFSFNKQMRPKYDHSLIDALVII